MAEYVCEIIAACMKVFRMEASSAVRDSSIHTLLAALDLHEHVPDQAALRALLFPSVCDDERPTAQPFLGAALLGAPQQEQVRPGLV